MSDKSETRTNGKQYAERDIVALDKAGGYYVRHVSAMTAEDLHDKSDIAAELAWRDFQLTASQAREQRLREALQKLDSCMALILPMARELAEVTDSDSHATNIATADEIVAETRPLALADRGKSDV